MRLRASSRSRADKGSRWVREAASARVAEVARDSSSRESSWQWRESAQARHRRASGLRVAEGARIARRARYAGRSRRSALEHRSALVGKVFAAGTFSRSKLRPRIPCAANHGFAEVRAGFGSDSGTVACAPDALIARVGACREGPGLPRPAASHSRLVSSGLEKRGLEESSAAEALSESSCK